MSARNAPARGPEVLADERRRSARRAKSQCELTLAGRLAVILTEFLPYRHRPLTTSRVAGDTFTFVCSSQRLEQPPCFSRCLPDCFWRGLCPPTPDPTALRRRRGPTRRRPPEYRSREPGPGRRRTATLTEGQSETRPRRRELLPAVPGRQRPLVRHVPPASRRVQPLTRHGRSAMAAAPACETTQPRRDRSSLPRDRRGRR